MDRYDLGEKLGEGGMGAVYRATDKELGRIVAVKVIAMAVDAESLRRFQREMKFLSKLSHQNIIRVYDSGQTADGRAYFAMELVEGADLDRKRKDAGPMPLDQVLPLLIQAADALATIHEQGLLHRDVKPANMMIEDGGRLVLMDFGLVKDPTATMLTQEGRAVGTPRYMPPEVLAARETTGAVDVWALGITAHELLSGRQVYPVNTLPEMMDMIVNHPPPDIEAAVTGLPKWFIDLHYSTLQKDPLLRPTAAHYRDMLKRRGASAASVSGQMKQRKMLTSSFKVVAPPPPPASISQSLSTVSQSLTSFADTITSRVGRIGVAALALGVVGVGAYLGFGRRGEPPPAPDQPRVAATAAPAAEAFEVRLVPPRRAVVQVSAALAVGAKISCNGISRSAEGTPANPNEAVFDDLPPATELTFTLTAADGRELSARTLKSPEPVRIGSIGCHPTDDSVMLDFDLAVPRKLTVSIHRPGQAAPVAEETREAGPRWFHHVFTGLRPHTDYIARATDNSGWSALVNMPFETRRIEHRKAMDELLPKFHTTWSRSLYDVDLLRAAPDPRAVPVLAKILSTADPMEVLDARKLLWIMEDLRDPGLSGMLFDIYLKNANKPISSEVFRGACTGRGPALVRAAPDLMDRVVSARRWILRSCADLGTPEACDRVAKVMDLDPSWMDERTPYLFVRIDPARARTHLKRWAEGANVEAFQRLAVCAALAVLGDGESAHVMGRLLKRPAGSVDRGLAARYLAPMPVAAARDVLLGAYQAEPDDAVLGWALAASGDPRAAEAFAARLNPQLAPRVRQDAAYSLGVLGASTPAVLSALRAALGQNPAEVAGAAAFALGELRDAAAVPALLAMADTPRDVDGFAALALCRIKHKAAVAPLAARLTALSTGPAPADARAWIRLAAIGAALGELGDPTAADALHALDRAANAPRGCRDVAQQALRRLARNAAELQNEQRVLIIPHVPAMRSGVTLYPGESAELWGNGVLCFTGPDAKPMPAEIEVAGPEGARLGIAALLGTTMMRVARGGNRINADQPAHLLVSCYDQFAPTLAIPRDRVAGFAFVTIRR